MLTMSGESDRRRRVNDMEHGFISPGSFQRRDVRLVTPNPQPTAIDVGGSKHLQVVSDSSPHMGKERMRLEVGGKLPSLADVRHFLGAQQFDPQSMFFEFDIDINKHPIDAVEIRNLLSFNYEFGLTEKNGQIVLTTGRKNGTGSNPDFINRRNRSGLSLHTHPIHTDGTVSVTTPSFNDVYVSDFADKTTPLVLAHADGLMIYRKPIWDPIENTPFHGDTRDMLLLYTVAQGIDIFGFNKQMRSVWELSDVEQVAMQRKFVEDTRMIVAEASWNDTEGVQHIMDVINLRSTGKSVS